VYSGAQTLKNEIEKTNETKKNNNEKNNVQKSHVVERRTNETIFPFNRRRYKVVRVDAGQYWVGGWMNHSAAYYYHAMERERERERETSTYLIQSTLNQPGKPVCTAYTTQCTRVLYSYMYIVIFFSPTLPTSFELYAIAILKRSYTNTCIYI